MSEFPWLIPGAIVFVNPQAIRRHRKQISELLEKPWLQVVSVTMPNVEVRRYRPNPDLGWCVGVEPITWMVPAVALLPRPRPRKAPENKVGFAMAAVVADHVEKEGEDVEF